MNYTQHFGLLFLGRYWGGLVRTKLGDLFQSLHVPGLEMKFLMITE